MAQDHDLDASFLRMFLLGIIVISPSFLCGLNLSFPTVALPQMNLSFSTASWFAAISGITASVGTITTGIVIDKLGRKSALIFSILPSIAGWLLLFWHYGDFTVLTGQALNGMTIGSVGYSSQVYAGECLMANHVRLRSSYIMWVSFNISMASLFLFTIALFLNYKQICALATTISFVILVLLCVFIPESPSWLYRQGRHEEAERSLRKLRMMKVTLKMPEGESIPLLQKEEGSHWSRFRRVLVKLRRPDVRKPLIIFSTFSLLYSFCGSFAVLTYAIQILEGSITYGQNSTSPAVGDTISLSVSEDSATAYEYNVFSGVLMVVSSISASFGIPYLGLKKTLLFSMVGNLAAMVVLACTATAADGFLFSLRVVGVWMNAFFSGLAFKTPFSAAGDALPPDAKGFTSISVLVGNVSSGLVRKIFPYLCVALGAYSYWLFAVVSVVCALHAYFCLTEVAGKTLDEINHEYLEETK